MSLLNLDKPIQDTIKVGDLELYLDGSFRPEWNATVVGEIHASAIMWSMDTSAMCLKSWAGIKRVTLVSGSTIGCPGDR